MQRRILGGLTALAAALPLASYAETMDYSYAEIGYVDTEFEGRGFDVDGDGFALRGSVAVNQTFFVFAGYEDIGLDEGVDLTTLNVGGGAHWPLNDRLDIVGRLGIVQAEIEAGPFEEDEDGFLLGARLRGAVSPKFELEGGVDYMDIDTGEDTFVVLEGRYFFVDQFAGGLGLQIGDDVTSIGLNLRVTF
ncbi:MAG TPA: outer membrane beta-barrel protein [Steroidobacteraceae bacterium]